MMYEESGMMNDEGGIKARSATLADSGVSMLRRAGGKGLPTLGISCRGLARFILHLSSCILFLWIGLAQAELSALINTDQISMGDTVQLQVEAQGQVSGNPDTQPLTHDFDVLGIASGSRVNIINGQMDARSTWTITLSPKRSGKLTIPALELNGQQTRPLTLQVSKVPMQDGKAAGDPLFIETEVDRKDPYVQGMLLYTVRLFYEVKLLQGHLSEPKLDNALVRRLGKDREYSVERNGHRYRVLKRQYAIFPQTSGQLEVPAPVLDARIPDRSSKRRNPMQDLFGRDPFDDRFFDDRFGDLFSATRPVRVRGEAQVLEVRPRPAQANGRQWLPAESLALIESWQPEQGQLRVGDPLTRTVTIRARGVTGEQLPELELGYMDGFKVYPDHSQANTQDLDGGVEGEKSRNIAYVPVQAGNYTLPAVRIHWWDTHTDQERVAELPERRVEVLPALAGQGMPVQPSAQPEITRHNAPAPTAEVGETPVTQTPSPPSGAANGAGILPPAYTGIWPWLSLLFALLWLTTLVVWWRGRRPAGIPRPTPGQKSRTGEDAAKAKSRFQAACRANDPSQARRNLLVWAAAHWPDDPPAGLDQLAQRLGDPHAREALNELDRLLYRGEDQTWNGKALAQALTRLPKPDRATGAKTALPDLYA